MLFNSLTFILLFLPVSLLGFYSIASLNTRLATVWLVVVSAVFYCWWTAGLIFLLAGSILFNFSCGAIILKAGASERWKSLFLFLGVTCNLSLLFFYKYFYPLLNWAGLHGFITYTHELSIILPLGISFFTFTQIGYLVDCRGGVVKKSNFLDYCLFVTFFPHLIAGPILHNREILPQFADPETYKFRFRNMAVGLTLFLMGLFKKVVIADRLAEHANTVFHNVPNPSVMEAWNGLFSYSLQLYFDFSGYSDMAIGLALLFGVRFPANFDSPYRSACIIDFWQRWHMSLTRYLTLYLYNPIALYISRRRLLKGKSVSKQSIATLDGFCSMIAFPTILTMTLAGIWHGAGLQFLVFGLLHGIYLTINHAYRNFGPRESKIPKPYWWKLTISLSQIALTYSAVLFAQVFFRAASVHQAIAYLKGMIGFNGFRVEHITADPVFALDNPMRPFPSPAWMAYLFMIYLVVWLLPDSLQMLNKYEPTLSKLRSISPIKFEWRPNFLWAFILALAAGMVFLEINQLTDFIYFRF